MSSDIQAPGRLVHVSPHRREGESVSLVMWTVARALLPAGVVGLYVFGWRALSVTAISVVSCVVAEWVSQAVRRVRVTVGDGSAVVTGVLLALVLPASVKWYVPVVGAVVAIGLAKQAFGGLGTNFFNPALVARAFLQFAFPTQVSLSRWPILADKTYPFWGIGRVARDCLSGPPDAVTAATPLALLKANPGVAWADVLAKADAESGSGFAPPVVWLMPRGLGVAVFALLVVCAVACVYLGVKRRKRLLPVFGVGALLLLGVVPVSAVSFGGIPGCIGETSAWALLLGGLALVYYRCINWELPAIFIATVAVFTLVLPVRGADGALVTGFADQERLLVHVFGGGLFLGAFFMITDMVTSPMTVRGQVIYGVLAGLLVALIRLYAGFPEGVCFSILLANAARPLIDRMTVPRVFGARKPAPEGAGGTGS